MADSDGKHVFVSYVHEDSAEVDGLCAVLEAARIPYWRDRTSLGPGDAWKSKIQAAIRDGSLVFLACFSDRSRAKAKSHMNEELTLAVEEYRKMPPGRTWLIPVRFDDGDVPPWELRTGQLLSDLNYADLFGSGHAAQAASLVTTIAQIMGDKQMSPATALAAVEQATSADRADLLRRLTKEMLLDPSRRIALDDLVSQEVRRVMAVLRDMGSPTTQMQVSGSAEARIVICAQQARKIWEVTEPFCASLQVAARWGTPDLMGPWASGLRSFVSATTRLEGGFTDLLNLRHVSGVAGLLTAAIACSSCRNWGNLKALVVDPTVRDQYVSKPLSIVEATDPYKPFDSDSWTPNVLAVASVKNVELEAALDDLTQNRVGKFHTPSAEWFHHILRSVFRDQLPDDDSYDGEFDRAEVMLGLLAQDSAHTRGAADPDDRGRNRAHWYGRSTWRSQNWHGNPVEDFQHELAGQGTLWGPLRGDLFGADADRAQATITAYLEIFNKFARNRF